MKQWKSYHTRGRWYTILNNGTVSYLASVCPQTASALADRLISVMDIEDRYKSHVQEIDFTTSAQLARAQWLEAWLKKKQ